MKEIGKLTEAEELALKAKHGVVRRYHTDLEEEGEETERHYTYAKDPTPDVVASFNAIAKNDEIKAAQNLFNSCRVAGSEMVKEHVGMFFGITEQIGKRMQPIGASVKKL